MFIIMHAAHHAELVQLKLKVHQVSSHKLFCVLWSSDCYACNISLLPFTLAAYFDRSLLFPLPLQFTVTVTHTSTTSARVTVTVTVTHSLSWWYLVV